MSDHAYTSGPLVSVIITCYNHGYYLSEAIDSVLAQTYQNFEIIVIDDGSIDNTKNVAARFNNVHYFYQNNQGLSASRNTGIRQSKGNYLVFLDADDWLLPNALLTNINILEQNRELAFVSGAHKKVSNLKETLEDEVIEISSKHYLHLLQGNYIGMHATVMYQRWLFEELLFDVSLRACEDYDLYLKTARKHPVAHHQKYIALYRIHGENMSGNIPFMLTTALSVLHRQRMNLKNEIEIAAYRKGLKIWKNYYCAKLYHKLSQSSEVNNAKEVKTLFKYSKYLYFKFMAKKLLNAFKKSIKKN